jgi:tight adherence protein C
MTDFLASTGQLTVALAVAAFMLLLWLLARMAPEPTALPARRRKEALSESLVFRLTLPFIQAVGVLVAPLPLEATRARYQALLRHSGYPGGLFPNELIAIQILSAIVLPLLLGYVYESVFDRWNHLVWLGALVGYFMPPSRLEDRIRVRVEAIERRLPYALDLIIVCAEAGCSFEDAVFRIVDATQDKDPLSEELRIMRQELELVDLRSALHHFAERVPSGEVTRLTHAILEGERQGTPYKDVLAMARDMMRTRQSTRIEKQAARAQQLLVIPTLLITGAVLVMLIGGMILRSCQDTPIRP